MDRKNNNNLPTNTDALDHGPNDDDDDNDFMKSSIHDIKSSINNNNNHNTPDAIAAETTLMNLFTHTVNRLGYGGILGLCVGQVVKETGKVIAYFVGGTFIFLQSLQYAGYIEIKWDKVHKDIVKRVDSDGSGMIGVKDVRYYLRKFIDIMVYQGPIAGGFATGFYVALLM